MEKIVLTVGVVVTVGVLFIFCKSVLVAKSTIFSLGKSPISLSKALLSYLHVTNQTLFGIFIVTTLTLLMMENVIESDAGLPLLSAVAGYLLARGTSEVGFDTEKP